MIKINSKSNGSWNRTKRFLSNAGKSQKKVFLILQKYGEQGVKALEAATPKDTATTAMSWAYQIIIKGDGTYSLNFVNNHPTKGKNVALWIQYGHATKNGGWVQGVDYINPAVQPIFDKIAKDSWEEVTNS